MQELRKDDLHLIVRRLPKDVQDSLREWSGRLFIGGGFIRAVIGNEEVNDIDFFGPSPDGLKQVCDGFRRQKNREDAQHLSTKNALTLAQPGKTTLQFIHRWRYDRPEDLLKSFDFSVCQAVVWYSEGRFRGLVGDDFYPDLAAKRLRYMRPVREEEAGGSMLRVIKYVKRGYRIQMEDLAAVMSRVVAQYDFARGRIDIDHFIRARMQEVDPLNVIDGIPVDDDVMVPGLEADGHDRP